MKFHLSSLRSVGRTSLDPASTVLQCWIEAERWNEELPACCHAADAAAVTALASEDGMNIRGFGNYYRIVLYCTPSPNLL